MADRASGQTQLYNVVTIVMLVLTAAVGISVLVRVASAGPLLAQQAPEPTLFVPSTLTPTLPPPTLPPTATTTLTPVPSATRTLLPTETPTSTPAGTATPTITLSPTGTQSPTPTPTYTPSPTSTHSPFDYVLQNSAVTYTTNFANSAGCNWAGIAGLVLDINRNPALGLRVHITGGGIDEYVISGSNPAYGAGGWERMVDNRPSSGMYYAQLESVSGERLSDVIAIQMIPGCNNNLALVNFIQVNP